MLHKSNISPQTNTLTYLIIGDDDFKKRGYLNGLRTKLIGKGVDAFNYSLFYSKDTRADDIIDFLETFSCTGGKKMAALIEPELSSEEERTKIISYIKRLRGTGAFFVMVGGKPSLKLNSFIKMLPKDTERIDTSSDKTEGLCTWVMKKFEKNKKKISRRNAELISDNTSNDIGKAVSVIEQALSFSGDRDTITEDDIMLFLDVPPDSSTFMLLDAVNAKKSDKALLILRQLLNTGTNPIQMIGFLSWHIVRLIRLKKMLLSGAARQDMLACLKISGYRLDRLIVQSREFTLGRLKKDLQALADTDTLIKRSGIKDDYLLEALIVKLAS
jgi:DNA polymerase III subunit delta